MVAVRAVSLFAAPINNLIIDIDFDQTLIRIKVVFVDPDVSLPEFPDVVITLFQKIDQSVVFRT